MYLKAFDGKRNGATVQRGGILWSSCWWWCCWFRSGNGGLYGPSGIGPSANLRVVHAALLEKCALMEQFSHKKGQLWDDVDEVAGILPGIEAAVCIRMSGQAMGSRGKFTLKAVALGQGGGAEGIDA